MAHYFTNEKNLKSNEKTFNINIKDNNYQFITDEGVFSKEYLDFGSKVLLDNIEVLESDKNILDLGCGYGPIGISLAKENPKKTVYMIDINERAVGLSTKNALKNNVSNVVIKANEILKDVTVKFDLIVTNPPIRAGKKTVFEFYEQSFKYLNDSGRLYVVIQRKQGAPTSLEKIEELFKNAEIIDKVKGYWIIRAIKNDILD